MMCLLYWQVHHCFFVFTLVFCFFFFRQKKTNNHVYNNNIKNKNKQKHQQNLYLTEARKLRASMLTRLSTAARARVARLDLYELFTPFVFQWLKNTRMRLLEWANNAVKIDTRTAIHDNVSQAINCFLLLFVCCCCSSVVADFSTLQ